MDQKDALLHSKAGPPKDQRLKTIPQINEKYTPFGPLGPQGVLGFVQKRLKIV